MKQSANTYGRVWVILALLVVVAHLLTACAPGAGQNLPDSRTSSRAGVAQAAPPPEVPAAPVAPAKTVNVAPVEIGDISVVYSYTGDIQSADSVNVMPMAAGRIEAVLVDVGDELKAGDPIATVESTVYAAQLRQAKAGLEVAQLGLTKMQEGARPEQIAAAQAAVQFARNAVNDLTTISDDERTAAVAAMAQAEAGLRLAQAEYDKVAWAGQVGMMPQALQLEQATIAYEAAKAAYELQTNPSDLQLSPMMVQLAQAELALAMAKKPFTETDFEMARAQIKLAEAAVDLASVQVNEATIRAPFDGIVAELYITEGSAAGPQAPVALLVSKKVEAVFNIEESRISQVAEGQNAALRVAAYPDQDFPAVVTSVAPIADQDSHTFVIKVTPIDDDYLLRSGMYADLSLLVEQTQAALLVPRAAVTQVNDQKKVYVLKDDNRVEGRMVSTGLADGDRIEILSGLTADQQVIIAGQAGLEDGDKVEVMNTLN
jgi:HlyD family secretion protein